MLNLGSELSRWLEKAGDFAVATVTGTGGSAPRPVGTSMLVSASGSVLGSLSGGCVEGAVVASALEALEERRPRCEHFGYSREDAFAVGLTCGGDLDVHITPVPDTHDGGRQRALFARLAESGPQEPLALVRRIDLGGRTDPGQTDGQRAGARSGAFLVPDPQRFRPADYLAQLEELTGSADAARSAAAQLATMLPGGRTGLLRLASGEEQCTGEPPTLLVETRLPAPRMLVFGANDFSEALLPAARLLGYSVTLCDARPVFARQARFRTADEVAVDWPHRYLAAEAAAGRIDGRTVVCVLTHDPKFDLPLLQTALGLDLAFLGVMGSQRSTRQRIGELLAAGVEPHALSRLHAPIGLDLQAVTPAEVAVSITAQIIAARNPAATGLPLSACSGPIHAGTIHSGTIHSGTARAGTAPDPVGSVPLDPVPSDPVPLDSVSRNSTASAADLDLTRVGGPAWT